MGERNDVPTCIRFGPFDVSSDSGEIRKNGIRLKLSGQAIQVLLILLETPGRLVTREELQQKLWPGASFGDFDHGLNAAVNRLREVLGDSATESRFIETFPRRGYRFIGEIATGQSAEAVLGADQRRALPGPWWQRRRNLGLFGSGVLLVLLFVGGAYILKRRPPISTKELNVVPLTTYPGFEVSPSFSPDGNEIVFSWNHGDESSGFRNDLYVKQIGNEHAVRLTNHEADFIVPAWSPDGRNIAFGMMGKDGNGIYIVPALGGRERQLAEFSKNNWQWLLLSWSPDSRRVAFASDSQVGKAGTTTRHYSIHLLDVETGDEQVLPDPAPDCTMTIEPAFSPDGRYLASVCVITLGVNKVYAQPIDGGRARELALVNTEYVLAGLAWTVDGRSVIYSTYGTNGSLWRVPATGGTREKLSFAHGVQTPAIARAGNKLAYAQANYHFDIWSIGLTPQTNGADPTRLISSSWDQTNAQVSPDGKFIAFVSNRSGDAEIWICDRDGSRPLRLTFLSSSSTGAPRWSPDSRKIVFASGGTGHGGLYLISARGGRPQQLTTGTSSAISPFWSADGKWIYFADESGDAIWKVPSDGGVALRLTKKGKYPQESADGKRVFFVVGEERNELWSVSANGGDEHREEGVPSFADAVSWAPAQNGVYFVDGPQSHFSVKYFDYGTRQIKVWGVNGMHFLCCGIAVSGNDTLLFSGIDHLESDIMMVEGFR